MEFDKETKSRMYTRLVRYEAHPTENRFVPVRVFREFVDGVFMTTRVTTLEWSDIRREAV